MATSWCARGMRCQTHVLLGLYGAKSNDLPSQEQRTAPRADSGKDENTPVSHGPTADGWFLLGACRAQPSCLCGCPAGGALAQGPQVVSGKPPRPNKEEHTCLPNRAVVPAPELDSTHQVSLETHDDAVQQAQCVLCCDRHYGRRRSPSMAVAPPV